MGFSASGKGCAVAACSESQVTSVYDYSTNYCNLHDLYCGKGDGCNQVNKNLDLSFEENNVNCSSGQHDASACAKTCGPTRGRHENALAPAVRVNETWAAEETRRVKGGKIPYHPVKKTPLLVDKKKKKKKKKKYSADTTA